MARNAYFLSYDARDNRRLRVGRRWPWYLFAICLAFALLGLLGLMLVDGDGPDLQLSEPVAIQEALPALLTTDSTIVYVIDDSDSMGNKVESLHEALRELDRKQTENSAVAVVRFGNDFSKLFDFREHSDAPWRSIISDFNATSGGTYMFTALSESVDMIQAQPECIVTKRWVIFSKTTCKDRRVVLMSDGMASDSDLAAEILPEIIQSGIPIDTVAFGDDADRTTLRLIADSTGGRSVTAFK